MIAQNDPIRAFEPLWGCWYAEDLLGEGGYGRVYRIVREDAGGRYFSACKHIRIPKNETEIEEARRLGMDEVSLSAFFDDTAKRIIKEIEIMYALRGESNIVSYEDHLIVDSPDGLGHDIFIRMELLVPLTAYIKDNRVTEAEVIRLGSEICTALEACEEYGVIHRDIKEGNVFLNPRGTFKLGDFGIARELSGASMGMSMRGTPSYIAPEVQAGKKYDATVDIYSLGILMYKLLNGGRYPFLPPPPQPIGMDEVEAALARRLAGETIPPPAFAKSALAKAVLRALVYEPCDRFRTAAEMKKALAAAAEGKEAGPEAGRGGERVLPAGDAEPAAVENTGDVQTPAKAKKSKKWIIAAVAAVLCIGVAAAALYASSHWDKLFNAAPAASTEKPLLEAEVPATLPPEETPAVLETETPEPETQTVSVNGVVLDGDYTLGVISIDGGLAESVTADAAAMEDGFAVAAMPVDDGFEEAARALLDGGADVLAVDLTGMEYADANAIVKLAFDAGAKVIFMNDPGYYFEDNYANAYTINNDATGDEMLAIAAETVKTAYDRADKAKKSVVNMLILTKEGNQAFFEMLTDTFIAGMYQSDEIVNALNNTSLYPFDSISQLKAMLNNNELEEMLRQGVTIVIADGAEACDAMTEKAEKLGLTVGTFDGEQTGGSVFVVCASNSSDGAELSAYGCGVLTFLPDNAQAASALMNALVNDGRLLVNRRLYPILSWVADDGTGIDTSAFAKAAIDAMAGEESTQTANAGNDGSTVNVASSPKPSSGSAATSAATAKPQATPKTSATAYATPTPKPSATAYTTPKPSSTQTATTAQPSPSTSGTTGTCLHNGGYTKRGWTVGSKTETEHHLTNVYFICKLCGEKVSEPDIVGAHTFVSETWYSPKDATTHTVMPGTYCSVCNYRVDGTDYDEPHDGYPCAKCGYGS